MTTDVTRILDDLAAGRPQAASELLPVVYAERRKLASAQLARLRPGQTLQPTALVHEAYLGMATTIVAAASSEVAPGETPAASAKLGRFFVLHKLGEGGRGVVYVEYDEVLDRRVALKLMRKRGSARAWLLREGQALGRLSSPHVVTVHEVDTARGAVRRGAGMGEVSRPGAPPASTAGTPSDGWVEVQLKPVAEVMKPGAAVFQKLNSAEAP